jgi:hypothetical protein
MATDISVHLSQIDDLFVDPDTNPLANPRLQVSGIQTVLNELLLRDADQDIHLRLHLPADQITSGLPEKLKEALQRYCAFQIQNLEAEIATTRYDGWRAFRVGVVGMAICMALAVVGYGIYGAASNPLWKIVGGLFGSFFSVASWVIIWNPMDLLVYGWRPLIRQVKKYQLIAQAQVTILPEG